MITEKLNTREMEDLGRIGKIRATLEARLKS